MSPVLAGLAVAIGVPILLFYVYGVVPVSLCRAGCAVSTTRDGFKFDFDEEETAYEIRMHPVWMRYRASVQPASVRSV